MNEPGVPAAAGDQAPQYLTDDYLAVFWDGLHAFERARGLPLSDPRPKPLEHDDVPDEEKERQKRRASLRVIQGGGDAE